jgi:Tol biopolymer transport system component
MKTKRIGMTAVFLLAAAFLLSGAGQQESAKQLFEKALHLEETKGDLEKAVEVYKRIVAEFPGERVLAAQSFYHLGLCYEKLGLRDAQKAFQNVIEAYPDQTATVRLAREKLAALARGQAAVEKTDTEFKITKVYTDIGRYGYFSPDGKKLALIDQKGNTLNIWLRDIVSGKEVRVLSTPGDLHDCWWSPDSQWIAYMNGTNSVVILPAEGGQPKTIIESAPEVQMGGDYVWPMGWTSDSKKLIAQDSAKGLFAIPVSGGNREEIYRFPDPKKAKERDEWMTLSPNGRLFAIQSTQDGNQDIYVMPAEGGERVRITDDPANDSWPLWSYDGQWLAFDSSRSGRNETWVVRITPDGKPGSPPIQATRGGGGGVWMQDGRIAYKTRKETVHVFVANADGSGEVQLTRSHEWNVVPRWSPDGKNIAFGSNYWEKWKTAVFTVPANGGDEKLLAVGGSFAWSADGRKIAFSAGTLRPPATAKISIIPAEGGEAKELMGYDGALTNLDWSPDGRSIAFSYARGKDAKNPIPGSRMDIEDIYIISVNGGMPKRLTQTDRKGFRFTSPRFSPDGKKIAFRSLDYEGWEKGRPSEPIGIYTMDVEGGEPKLVINDFGDWWFCWSPDGQNIIYPEQEKDSSGPYGADRRLYKVSAEGGTPEKLNIWGRMPDFSPDGKKIAYSRISESETEFWLVENFLPKSADEK